MEKRLKMEKRKELLAFFKEMEANIYKSLQRGERIPGVNELTIEAPQEPMVPLMAMVPTGDWKPRVRTISGMDESLLAELKLGTKAAAPAALAPKPHSTAPANVGGRPPLPTGRRPSSRELVSSDSFELSPEEVPEKRISRLDSDVGVELAGERLLDGPTDETVGLTTKLAMVAGQKFHVRRNTGGTIYVKTTMTNPDIKATIKVCCSSE